MQGLHFEHSRIINYDSKIFSVQCDRLQIDKIVGNTKIVCPAIDKNGQKL